MKIRFTLTLTDETVKAFKQVEDCEDGNAVAAVLKQQLQDKVDEVNAMYDPTTDDQYEGEEEVEETEGSHR